MSDTAAPTIPFARPVGSPFISLGSTDAEVCIDGVCAVPSSATEAQPTDVEKVVSSLDEGSTDY
ncbi:hypothetical protein [Naasia lichenicola]|uniref:Uncharacterized protein n=1 Tax=Naasia lichenicola TaxID=2565933 RepID=A0A4S4FEP7_9MICO|nr:hypothetical protein [Naasia lichenicola]THG28132.1 hypothetical protein E6C64_18630 [Naasia lichenicola]